MQGLAVTSNKALGFRPSLPARARRSLKVKAEGVQEKVKDEGVQETGIVTSEASKGGQETGLLRSEASSAPPSGFVQNEDRRWGYKPPRVPAIVEAEAEGLRTVNGVKKAGIWFGSEQSLSYLDGSLAGDFGFDPLGIYDPEAQGGVITQEWLRNAEVIHGRYAMLGAAGCIAPEFLGKLHIIPDSTALIWYKAGVIGPLSEGFNYWSDPYTIFFGQIVLMQFAELRRLQDLKKPGCMKEQYFLGFEGAFEGTGDPNYPGGPIFNFLHFGDERCMFKACRTEESLNEMKIREIKHARMAMLAMFGYGAQAVLCGGGPIQNLLDHILDPAHVNLAGNLIK